MYLTKLRDSGEISYSSRPLLSRSGCILEIIEEFEQVEQVLVPFYRGAVVFTFETIKDEKTFEFSSPFIEERLYFVNADLSGADLSVLVPFYRGAVVF